ESLSFWDNIKRVLLVAFPMLVSISLVVGGIVIMNIMLVSVTERTREIGLRKALGARQRDIQLQVLVEAATLSGAGALLGIGIGLVLAQIVSAVSPMPVALAPTWMAVSVALGVGVGVIAGIYPATRAARLDPVVALRQEYTMRLESLQEGARLAIDQLRANKFRSVLTIIASVIGVATVMATSGLVNGMRSSVMGAFEGRGRNNCMVARFYFNSVRIVS